MTQTRQEKLKIKVKELHKAAAIMKVSSIVRPFLEDNPDFTESIKLHVVSFDIKELKGADNDRTQTLMLNAACLAALNYPAVQRKTARTISKIDRNVTVEFLLTETEAHVILTRI